MTLGNVSGLAELVQVAEAHVKVHLAQGKVDSSHHYWHVARVRALALQLAQAHVPAVSTPDDLRIIELCALLHDLADWKYAGCDKAGPEAVQAFLEQHRAPSDVVETVLFAVRHIGFKDSLAQEAAPVAPSPIAKAALALVQDADRLDAIGEP
jgi:uncharacterized protein